MKIKASADSALRSGVTHQPHNSLRSILVGIGFETLFRCESANLQRIVICLMVLSSYGLTSVTPVVAQSVLSFDQVLKENQNPINGLAGAVHLAVSSDGRMVYVAGNSDDAIAVFSVDSLSNTLRFIEAKKDNLGGVDGLNGAHSLAISPDGKYLYATGDTDDAVVTFSRNATTGRLEIVDIERNGVAGITGLNGAAALAISPNGKQVYVTGQFDNSLVAFSRDTTSGELGFLAKYTDDQGGVDGLSGALALVISPDGKHVYAAANGEEKVSVFSRNDSTGILTFIEVKTDNTGGVNGLDGVTGIGVSPDGKTVYATSNLDDAVAVFSRDGSTGTLTFTEVQEDGTGGVEGLNGASYAVVSDDGRQSMSPVLPTGR